VIFTQLQTAVLGSLSSYRLFSGTYKVYRVLFNNSNPDRNPNPVTNPNPNPRRKLRRL